MPRIFVTRPLPELISHQLQAIADVDTWPNQLPPSAEELIQHAAGCDGLVSLLSDRIDANVMDAIGPQLKVIANYAVGVNNIDLSAAHSRDIAVGNTPDVLTDATADIAIGLALAASRRFGEAIQNVRQQEWKTWEPLGFIGHDFTGRTLGIVGMGRIGFATAKRMFAGWNMNVIYTSRTSKPHVDKELNARQVDFEELVSTSDLISIHTDLNPATKQMFDANAFQMMKPNCVLVNTARGAVIDQEALGDALKNRQIFAAGLDVTEPEPLPTDSALHSLPNCLILPHIGSATVTSRQSMAEIVVANVTAGLNGQPLPHAVS